ncbi:MAG: hypothetical protein QS98_C0002G0096 [archaeon GW2011_AR3]|nr:MAG: hypothetical protein QS98_C0002G0096 [archaeon GW2011_AR3]MBS3109914.1 hypothetical protein [Candidatus Woesearchaeota archaeon]
MNRSKGEKMADVSEPLNVHQELYTINADDLVYERFPERLRQDYVYQILYDYYEFVPNPRGQVFQVAKRTATRYTEAKDLLDLWSKEGNDITKHFRASKDVFDKNRIHKDDYNKLELRIRKLGKADLPPPAHSSFV